MKIVEQVAKAIAELKNVMAKTVKRFRTWLADQRNFLFARYTKDAQETQEPEKSLVQLPPETRARLIDRVKNLPSNPADKKVIASKLDEAYEIWHKDPSNADNSVVVLSSPVATVSRILSETLEEWADVKQVRLKLLSLKARPIEIESIVSKLEHHLKESDSIKDEASNQLEIVVIPNLSWVFFAFNRRFRRNRIYLLITV